MSAVEKIFKHDQGAVPLFMLMIQMFSKIDVVSNIVPL